MVSTKQLKLNKDWEKLPVDTKYFKDIELEIIGLFDNLDAELDGRLIKSDNFQALNTLLPKYKEQVQTIYIDPPFNLGENASYDYLVNYKDSTWATILENRLSISENILSDCGSIFVRCDSNGNWIVRPILDSIFDNQNFRNEIIINKSIRIKTEGNKLPTWHDIFYYYSKNKDNVYFKHPTEKREAEEWRSIDTEGDSWEVVPGSMIHLFSKENLKKNEDGEWITRARIICGREIVPREGRRFPSQNVILKLEKLNRIRLNDNDNPQMLKPAEIYLTDNWSDVYGYASNWDFQTENSEIGIYRCIILSSKKDGLVVDYFLGSGSTTAVAHKLNRKWVGIEIGEQFYEKALPRMKLVLNYDKTGISKEIKDYNGGGFFKYYELEQYEDALKKAVYNPADGELENIDFSLSEKQAKVALDIDLEKERAKFVFEKLYPDVDIPETISNLFGKKIKKITKDKVIFADDSEVDPNNLDFKKYEPLKKLIYW